MASETTHERAERLARGFKESAEISCFRSNADYRDVAETLRALLAETEALKVALVALTREDGDDGCARCLVRMADEITCLRAKVSDAEMERDKWYNKYRNLETRLVGDTGRDAMTIAAEARKYRPMYEAADSLASERLHTISVMQQEILAAEDAQRKAVAVALEEAVSATYYACAATGHVTLGHSAGDAIRNIDKDTLVRKVMSE